MRALVVEKSDDGTAASVQEIDEARLPAGDVTGVVMAAKA